MKPFDSNIIKIIKKCSYEMFLVQQDFNVDCTCVNFTTKQASDTCEKCLGTGKKIKIRKIKAAPQNNKTIFRGTGVAEIATTSTYYMKPEYPISQENIIVDGENIDLIQRVESMRSDHHEPVYYRCEANPKKTNNKVFLKNFNKIIGRG
jgi:excinuclease UvrABC ATPase subunit